LSTLYSFFLFNIDLQPPLSSTYIIPAIPLSSVVASITHILFYAFLQFPIFYLMFSLSMVSDFSLLSLLLLSGHHFRPPWTCSKKTNIGFVFFIVRYLYYSTPSCILGTLPESHHTPPPASFSATMNMLIRKTYIRLVRFVVRSFYCSTFFLHFGHLRRRATTYHRQLVSGHYFRSKLKSEIQRQKGWFDWWWWWVRHQMCGEKQLNVLKNNKNVLKH